MVRGGGDQRSPRGGRFFVLWPVGGLRVASCRETRTGSVGFGLGPWFCLCGHTLLVGLTRGGEGQNFLEGWRKASRVGVEPFWGHCGGLKPPCPSRGGRGGAMRLLVDFNKGISISIYFKMKS